jgi:hypothetical protein
MDIVMLASLVNIVTVCGGAQVVQESTVMHNNVVSSGMSVVDTL